LLAQTIDGGGGNPYLSLADVWKKTFMVVIVLPDMVQGFVRYADRHVREFPQCRSFSL